MKSVPRLSVAAVVVGLLAAMLSAVGPVAAASAAAASPSQMITVSAQPGSTYAKLSAWQKGASGSWTRVLGPVDARVGENGVSATKAREMALYTPTGTWPLGTAFGSKADPGTRMPYFKTDPLDWWVSAAGPTYNTHVRQVSNPGAASENLLAAGNAYSYAIDMGYNRSPIVQGMGSAFFLHVGTGSATAGCVSISSPDLVKLLRWLDPAQHPVISVKLGAEYIPPSPDPTGSVDTATAVTGGVRTTGWVYDREAPAVSTKAKITVTDTAGRVQTSTVVAAIGRPDVNRVLGINGKHGFSVTVRTKPGRQKVCVTAVNRGVGKDVSLGCRTVTVKPTTVGHLDRVAVAGRTIMVTGWAGDVGRDARAHVYLVQGTSKRSLSIGTPGTRNDAAKKYPGVGTQTGFSTTMSAKAGAAKVCVFSVASSTVELGCRSVTVG